MNIKPTIYLILSVVILIMTFFAIFNSFEKIKFIGFETEIICIPIWVAVVLLPILNVYEIAIHTSDYNKYYWISLVLNVLTILFILRYFKMNLF